MKRNPSIFQRPLVATLLASCALPAGILLLTTEESPAPVAVRGPRGGGAVAGARGGAVRGPYGGGAAAVRPGVGYAGVVRRTTRRTVRRLTVLPAGYRTVYYGGVRYYYVGGVHYQPYYEGNTVVYVEVNINP